MIWRSSWTHRAATPIAGYTIIGFFGPVVSLIISIGMANVAGATKKSCTAAAIFVAYCVGNVSHDDTFTTLIVQSPDIGVADYWTATHQDADNQTALS